MDSINHWSTTNDVPQFTVSAFLKFEYFISLDPISLSLLYNSVENIRFWCVVNEIHRSVDMLRAPTCDDKSDHDESDIRTFAEEIFEKYVRVESELQMNFQQVKGERLKRK